MYFKSETWSHQNNGLLKRKQGRALNQERGESASSSAGERKSGHTIGSFPQRIWLTTKKNLAPKKRKKIFKRRLSPGVFFSGQLANTIIMISLFLAQRCFIYKRISTSLAPAHTHTHSQAQKHGMSVGYFRYFCYFRLFCLILFWLFLGQPDGAHRMTVKRY